jgi:ABC-type dipeptide/oligopeptide/nickel transport system ATPase subunit
MNLLSVENLCYRVNLKKGGYVEILRDISFNLEEGIILGITGESGAGKTTLAKIIAGHLSPSEGKVKLDSSVQILFQNTGDILNPFRKVFDVVSEAASIRLKDKKASAAEAEGILELLQFDTSLWYNRGYELSGGQQQRAALARLLAVHPALLVLDEPFAAQDLVSQVNLLKLLLEVKEKFNLTIICISHNLKILRKFAARIIILKEGTIIEEGDVTSLFLSPAHSYTRLLLRAEEFNLSQEEKKMLRDSRD